MIGPVSWTSWQTLIGLEPGGDVFEKVTFDAVYYSMVDDHSGLLNITGFHEFVKRRS